MSLDELRVQFFPIGQCNTYRSPDSRGTQKDHIIIRKLTWPFLHAEANFAPSGAQAIHSIQCLWAAMYFGKYYIASAFHTTNWAYFQYQPIHKRFNIKVDSSIHIQLPLHENRLCHSRLCLSNSLRSTLHRSRWRLYWIVRTALRACWAVIR